jgi:ferritin-like metal-binding protein YciE
VEIIIYRAKKDGEKKVRIAAFEALADIGDEKALAFLTEYLENERSPQEFRTLIASELIEKRLSSSLSSIEKVIAQEWTKDNSRLLDSLCKILSRTKAEGLEKVFEKMLEHRSFIIQIYAMRGIGKNSLSALKEKVEELTKENHHPLVRKNALSALENL